MINAISSNHIRGPVNPHKDVGCGKKPSGQNIDFNRRRKLDVSEISVLRRQAEQTNENLRKMVEELILKQGKDYRAFRAKGFSDKDGTNKTGIEGARLAISDDGEFGVKAVSDRLVDFAISVSGGDKTKFSELKTAIKNGFAAARETLGGYLPDICLDTYNETMRKLEAWANED